MKTIAAWLLAAALPSSIASPARLASRDDADCEATASTLTDCLTTAKVPQYASSTSNYTQEIKPFNLRLPFTPAAVVVPTNTSQVQAAVSCAAKLGIKVSPKAGGHSYASHGLGGEDGHLMIDLKFMNNVTVDQATQIATIGPAARLGNVATALYDQGKRAITHGTCPGVGIGGHVLGGGYGLSSHTYGLALDDLVEAQVVLADASVVTASKTQNSDLFWALRGAGASFGIVTSYKFQTFAAPDNNTVFTYSLSNFNQTRARATFEAFQNYTNTTMPNEMNLRLFANSYQNTISGVYYGSQADFNKSIAPFANQLPWLPKPSVSSKNWINTLLANSNGPLAQPLNYDYHELFFAKSLMTKAVSPAGMDAFTTYWFNVSKTITRDWYLIIDAHGGPTSAITKVPKGDTSYAHRQALLKYELYDRVNTFFGSSTYPPDGFSFLNGWVDTIDKNTPETVGMYVNYADPSLNISTAHNRYYLDSYPKLSTIKKTVDPGNLITNPQAVTPA